MTADLPQRIRLSYSGQTAELSHDPVTEHGVMLSIGGDEQSHVEVGDPTFCSMTTFGGCDQCSPHGHQGKRRRPRLGSSPGRGCADTAPVDGAVAARNDPHCGRY